MIRSCVSVLRKHRVTEGNSPVLCFPQPPPFRGAGEHWIPARERSWEQCPCGAVSYLCLRLDRYFHADGSEMAPCWTGNLREERIELSPHALYRFWCGNELLYIGITINPAVRWKQHQAERFWWNEVSHIAVTCYPSRALVLEAEASAIKIRAPEIQCRLESAMNGCDLLGQGCTCGHPLLSHYRNPECRYCSCRLDPVCECGFTVSRHVVTR